MPDWLYNRGRSCRKDAMFVQYLMAVERAQGNFDSKASAGSSEAGLCEREDTPVEQGKCAINHSQMLTAGAVPAASLEAANSSS